jgi:hypothetical protein
MEVLFIGVMTRLSSEKKFKVNRIRRNRACEDLGGELPLFYFNKLFFDLLML